LEPDRVPAVREAVEEEEEEGKRGKCIMRKMSFHIPMRK